MDRKVLLAWELGANLGHLAPLRIVARHLAARGWNSVFVVRELEGAEECLEPTLGPVLQAPARLAGGRNPVRTQISYTSLLNNVGFDHIIGLAARLRAWRQLLQDQHIALVIADHSPTALLAARTLGIPRAQLGTGFTVPPLTRPFRVFQPQADIARNILEHNESAVLSNVNGALARLGLPALAALQDVFEGCASFVTSFPELDHYEGARSEPYIGVPDCAHGIEPPWPEGSGPRVLAYLRPSRLLENTLTALNLLPARVVVRIGGIGPARLQSFVRPGMVIVDQAVHMRHAAESCDAFVSYASHGMAAEMLLAGKPGLLLPDTVERLLVARRVVQLGAGLQAPVEGDVDVPAALRRLLDDRALHRAALAFAQRHHHLARGSILPDMTDRILERFSLVRAP